MRICKSLLSLYLRIRPYNNKLFKLHFAISRVVNISALKLSPRAHGLSSLALSLSLSFFSRSFHGRSAPSSSKYIESASIPLHAATTASSLIKHRQVAPNRECSRSGCCWCVLLYSYSGRCCDISRSQEKERESSSSPGSHRASSQHQLRGGLSGFTPFPSACIYAVESRPLNLYP